MTGMTTDATKAFSHFRLPCGSWISATADAFDVERSSSLRRGQFVEVVAERGDRAQVSVRFQLAVEEVDVGAYAVGFEAVDEAEPGSTV
ncbi:MAG: hypothetical protein JWQ95_6225 [Sphaerisporangium sp.]|nr:hypothetical protein [Sphaerisporangium sp.]